MCGRIWVQGCCIVGQLAQQEVVERCLGRCGGLPGSVINGVMTGSQAAGSIDVLLVCLRPSTGQAGPHRRRIVVPAPCVCAVPRLAKPLERLKQKHAAFMQRMVRERTHAAGQQLSGWVSSPPRPQHTSQGVSQPQAFQCRPAAEMTVCSC